MKVCLDLFAGLGGFSEAFEASEDWNVITVDIEEKFEPDIHADVMDLRPSDLPDAKVVLASPPCKEFSPAQNLNGAFEPNPEAIALVYHAIGLIKALRPDYWVLENPKGRLRSIIGAPTTTVTYCQYGQERMKPTDLWGDHPDGFTGLACQPGDSCHVNTRAGSNVARHELGYETSAERAKVPEALSQAILSAVEGEAEQTTLPL